MPSATMPTKDGHSFAGYYDQTSAVKQYYNAEGTSENTWDKTGVQTLYAHWKAKNTTVKYHNKTIDEDKIVKTIDYTFGEPINPATNRFFG